MEMEKERTCATLLLIAMIGRNHGQIQLFSCSKYPLIICLNPQFDLLSSRFDCWEPSIHVYLHSLHDLSPLSFISLFSFSSTCSSFSITSYHSHDLIAFSRGTFFIFWHQNGLCNAFSISLPPPPFWIFCQQASSPAPLLTQYLSLKLTMISFPCSVWSLYHCLL